MTDIERAYHNSFKPTWGPGDTLVYAMPRDNSNAGRWTASARSRINKKERVLVSEGCEIHLAELRTAPEVYFISSLNQTERC